MDERTGEETICNLPVNTDVSTNWRGLSTPPLLAAAHTFQGPAAGFYICGMCGYILTTDQSDTGCAGIFSRWTNRMQGSAAGFYICKQPDYLKEGKPRVMMATERFE
eukprot:142799-Prorocentrum_minimum.AAC.1